MREELAAAADSIAYAVEQLHINVTNAIAAHCAGAQQVLDALNGAAGAVRAQLSLLPKLEDIDNELGVNAVQLRAIANGAMVVDCTADALLQLEPTLLPAVSVVVCLAERWCPDTPLKYGWIVDSLSAQYTRVHAPKVYSRQSKTVFHVELRDNNDQNVQHAARIDAYLLLNSSGWQLAKMVDPNPMHEQDGNWTRTIAFCESTLQAQKTLLVQLRVHGMVLGQWKLHRPFGMGAIVGDKQDWTHGG